jgi:hypothetical protein
LFSLYSKKKVIQEGKTESKAFFFFFFTGEFENETCLELRLSREANV